MAMVSFNENRKKWDNVHCKWNVPSAATAAVTAAAMSAFLLHTDSKIWRKKKHALSIASYAAYGELYVINSWKEHWQFSRTKKCIDGETKWLNNHNKRNKYIYYKQLNNIKEYRYLCSASVTANEVAQRFQSPSEQNKNDSLVCFLYKTAYIQMTKLNWRNKKENI